MVETLPGKRPLTFAVLGSHAYFYTGRVARALANRRPHDYEKLRRDVQNTTTPDAAEWLALPDLAVGLPQPGHYFVDEDHIDTVRGQFLRTGRHPKCILKDMHVTKSLRYTFVRGRDSHKGVLHIHGMPAFSLEIMDWLRALDLRIPYRGEGLRIGSSWR